MPQLNFPIFKTKVPGVTESFRLEDPAERRRYFDAKARTEIEKLRDWLRGHTFVAFLMGPKNSGKGTYTKMFMEAVGGERVAHISVGDIVRAVHADLGDPRKRDELFSFLKERYRGFISLDQVADIIEGRDVKTLLPTEVVLGLVEREISRIGRKAVFIDGFPRSLDQVSYSLYFRSIIGYRDDPDFFVFIDVPQEIIDERIRYRVVCPACQTPRNLKLLRTNKIGYDEAAKDFYLVCDNPNCQEFGAARLRGKESDALGIEPIRDRIEADYNVMAELTKLEGVPKIFLRNSIPAALASEYADEYELTPASRYEWDGDSKSVRVIDELWSVESGGEKLYSLLPAPVGLSLIKQVSRVLGL